MLALFRCISCKYTFSTTTDAPDLLGAPGRIFATGEVTPVRANVGLNSDPGSGRAGVRPAARHLSSSGCHASQRSGAGHDTPNAPRLRTASCDVPGRVASCSRQCATRPQPEFLADVQQCSKAVYLRVEEATQCAVRRRAMQAASAIALNRVHAGVQ